MRDGHIFSQLPSKRFLFCQASVTSLKGSRYQCYGVHRGNLLYFYYRNRLIWRGGASWTCSLEGRIFSLINLMISQHWLLLSKRDCQPSKHRILLSRNKSSISYDSVHVHVCFRETSSSSSSFCNSRVFITAPTQQLLQLVSYPVKIVKEC